MDTSFWRIPGITWKNGTEESEKLLKWEARDFLVAISSQKSSICYAFSSTNLSTKNHEVTLCPAQIIYSEAGIWLSYSFHWQLALLVRYFIILHDFHPYVTTRNKRFTYGRFSCHRSTAYKSLDSSNYRWTSQRLFPLSMAVSWLYGNHTPFLELFARGNPFFEVSISGTFDINVQVKLCTVKVE